MNRIFVPTINADDWKKYLAEPDKHWKTGYSARTLAHCWEDSIGFPSEIKIMFDSSGFSHLLDMQVLFSFPEYKVTLPGGKRSSQNDIYVIAKNLKGSLVSITVEGKVSESFGPTLLEWDISSSIGRQIRINYIKKLLGLQIELDMNIRYQLLHRMASAVIEADKINAKYALMVVHSFHSENKGFEDFDSFVELFGQKAVIGKMVKINNVNGIELYAGWAKGNQKYLIK